MIDRRSARLSLLRSLAMLALMIGLAAAFPGPGGAVGTALTRYPYLTDSVQTSITVNWATDRSATTGSVAWGPPGSCTAHTAPATRTGIQVFAADGTAVNEYQWAASIPVSPDTTYCYRVFLAGTDLLGSDQSPQFSSQVAAGSTASFSFDVFGDWGQSYAGGTNPDQANVMQQMANSGARFAVMTGDTAYPSGGQKEYGDLWQTGTDLSTVFAPQFWAVPGRSLPVFNVTGNHGFTNGAIQIVNWPEGNAAQTSNGRYVMETYPSINGSTSKSYPSMWYAFDAGPARFYILTAAWADGNVGTGSVYANDAAAHWTPSSAEYQWLQSDLAAHPNGLKFAFWHYPLYADSGGQPSDTSLRGGAGTLQGLLDQYHVAIAFNGHAHGYERNLPDPANLVTYVLGNGGAALGSVSGCHSFDAYAIGANGSHCGAAPAGLSNDHVFGFAKVTVNGSQVTVTPTDEMGRTYDVQTYALSSTPPDTQSPTPPTTVTASAPASNRIDLNWSGATDNVGVSGYRVYRDGVALTTVTGASYSDTAVTASTTYSYEITALDRAGNESARSSPATSVTTPGTPDTTPPSQPGGLAALAAGGGRVNLSWTASTDNVGVTGYKVYRDGAPLSTVTGTPVPTGYTDDTAAAGTAYTYEVSALDGAGNESSRASATVTTPAGSGSTLTFAPTDDATIDQSQPTVNFGSATRLTVDNSPVNNALLKFTVSGTAGCSVTGAKLRLTVGSATDDKSVHGGEVFGAANSNWSQSTVTWNTAPAVSTAQLATLGAVNGGTAYLLDVTPLLTGDGVITIRMSSTNSDGARYYSTEGSPTQAPQLQVTCGSPGTPDTTPPSQPGGLAALAAGGGRVNLSWTASTDNVGVTGYKVYRDGAPLSTVTGTPVPTGYTDDTAAAGTAYTYEVSALDGAGNESSRASATVTTPAGSGSTLTFAPTDDATIDQSQPTVNFGSATRLTVDNSPVNNALLKFTVSGTAGCSVTGAKLRLTVGSATDDKSVHGGEVFGAANSNWSQSTVTWNTAPAVSTAQLATLGAVSGGTAYLLDVTPLLTGDGVITIRMSSTNSDGARYYSTEGSPTQAPQLQVTCG